MASQPASPEMQRIALSKSQFAHAPKSSTELPVCRPLPSLRAERGFHSCARPIRQLSVLAAPAFWLSLPSPPTRFLQWLRTHSCWAPGCGVSWKSSRVLPEGLWGSWDVAAPIQCLLDKPMNNSARHTWNVSTAPDSLCKPSATTGAKSACHLRKLNPHVYDCWCRFVWAPAYGDGEQPISVQVIQSDFMIIFSNSSWKKRHFLPKALAFRNSRGQQGCCLQDRKCIFFLNTFAQNKQNQFL